MRYVLPFVGRKVSSGGSLTFVGKANGVAETTSTLSITLPAGRQIGDLVVLVVGAVGVFPATPTGYTKVVEYGPGGVVCSVFIKKLVALDSATPGISTGGSSAFAGTVHVWRNVNTTAMDATPTVGAGTTPVNPSITPVTSGAVVLAVGSATSSIATSFTSPAGYLEPITANTTSFNVFSGIAYKNWTSGAENPPDWVQSPSTGGDSGVGITLALRPL